MSRTRVLAAAVTSAALLTTLSACGGDHDDKKSSSPSASADAASPAVAPKVAPLTGLKVDGHANRPALTVKIENSTDARPQSGLDKADIVMEELVEGGITRFAALFQSTDPGEVGPVRSVRNVDASITGPTHGLFAYSGGAGHVLKIVKQAPVQTMTEGSPSDAFHRVSSRYAPHNLYATASKLWAHAKSGHDSAPAPYLPFAKDAASAATASGKAATSLKLTFSPGEHPNWSYDAAAGKWLRSEWSNPAKVASGARLKADNIIVMRVKTRDAGYKDPAGNFVPETVLTGSGKVTVLTGGKYVTGTWHKDSRDSAFTFTTQDGRQLDIAPGKSWIELVPSEGTVSIS